MVETRPAIAVTAIKGGTGKTMVASNLARLLKVAYRLAVIDADIDSPSIPKALGIPEHLRLQVEPRQRMWVPVDWKGMKVHSNGLFAARRAAVTQPGEMHRGWLADTVARTTWGNVDLFLVDLPAGSGDELLAVAEAFKNLALVLVAIPRNLESAERVVQVAQHHKMRILGVIENMTAHYCSACGAVSHPLGRGETEQFSRGYGLPYLGSIPMAEGVSDAMQRGDPVPTELTAPIVGASVAVTNWVRSLGQVVAQ